MKQSIEELIYEETQRRLEIMGQSDYQFPKKADRRDFMMILALIVVSALLIILCMTGVIE